MCKTAFNPLVRIMWSLSNICSPRTWPHCKLPTPATNSSRSEGEIKVRFTVSTAGHVIAASLLSSTTNNARLEQLILEKIRRWGDFGEVSPEVGNQTFRQNLVFVDAAQTDEPAVTTNNFTSASLTR